MPQLMPLPVIGAYFIKVSVIICLNTCSGCFHLMLYILQQNPFTKHYFALNLIKDQHSFGEGDDSIYLLITIQLQIIFVLYMRAK